MLLSLLLDVAIDTIIDTAKMIPFLFIAYLVIEYIEHKKSHRMEAILSKGGKYGFIPGALLGSLPQCGFSAMASNFYASRVITLGTLMAVYLATSDEAIPIMLSHPESYKSLLLLVGIKIVYAVAVGFMIDVVFRKFFPEKLKGGYGGNISAVSCHEEDGNDSILKAAIKHTANILAYMLVITFVFGLLVELLGQERLSAFMGSITFFQPFVAALFGLIPNCASSIILTQLYLSQTITFGALLAGLSANAGVGLLILFKSNKDLRQNLFILLLLYVTGTLLGLLINGIGLQ